MNPSEELRLLHARIAQLERQQTTNLPTSSSAGFDLMAQNAKRRRIEGENEEHEELVGRKLEQMEEWKRITKLELENKALRAELEHQKLLIAHNALLTKVEKYQKEQQETGVKMEKYQKELQEKVVKMEKYQKELQEKVVKMEKYQKEQQQNISNLQKTVAALREIGLTLQNRWNSAACHGGLTLSEPDRLIGQYNGKKEGARSVLAERPIPKKDFGIFYYEVTIVEERIPSSHWTCDKTNAIVQMCWTLRRHFRIRRRWHFLGSRGERIFPPRQWTSLHHFGKPKFEAGDVIGCGVDLATRQIIYTKNGQRLETTGLCVDSGVDLFPCVTLHEPGTKIEANFGPNFKFNIAANGI